MAKGAGQRPNRRVRLGGLRGYPSAKAVATPTKIKDLSALYVDQINGKGNDEQRAWFKKSSIVLRGNADRHALLRGDRDEANAILHGERRSPSASKTESFGPGSSSRDLPASIFAFNMVFFLSMAMFLSIAICALRWECSLMLPGSAPAGAASFAAKPDPQKRTPKTVGDAMSSLWRQLP